MRAETRLQDRVAAVSAVRWADALAIGIAAKDSPGGGDGGERFVIDALMGAGTARIGKAEVKPAGLAAPIRPDLRETGGLVCARRLCLKASR